jgi:undecaprenyl-diphosphatase
VIPATFVAAIRRRGESFFLRPRPPLSLGIAFLVCFVVVAILVPSGPLEIERRWLEWMREIRAPILDDLALVLNWLGHGLGRALVLAAIATPLIATRRWAAAIAFAVTETLTPLLTDAVKALVNRPRPLHGLVHAGAASFPSGHASFAGATLVALVLLFTQPQPRRRLWWTLAGLGIVAMSWSRTYLHVHWLLDVVAGSFLGVGLGLVIFALVQISFPPAAAAGHRVSSAWQRQATG